MDPVGILEKHVGYHETGDNCNIFSHYDGRPCEAWCFDTVDACYGMSGHPLPAMQPGISHGAASVWYGFTWASHHGLVVPAHEAQRNDAVCFGWQGKGINGSPDEMHIALVREVADGTLHEIGGNQSDHVSEESYPVDSNLIMGVIQLHKFLGAKHTHPHHKPAPGPEHGEPKHPVNQHAKLALPPWNPHWPARYMIKTPRMHGPAVEEWKKRMHARGWDTIPHGTPFTFGHGGEKFTVNDRFGDHAAAVAWAFQHDQGITKDGQLGPQTWLYASREDNINRDK